MGQIFVEGLGNVVIEGDEPNESEINAIVAAVGEGEGDPTITETLPPASLRPENFLPAEQGRMPGKPLLSSEEERKEPQNQKERTRQSIEESPGLVQFVAESSPAMVGAAVGAHRGAMVGGAVGGPIGATAGGVVGAGVGGLIGEFAAQKTGISPESDLNLALAAGGPAMGIAVGSTLRLGRAVGGLLTRKLPLTRTALGQIEFSKAALEFESLGTRLASKPRGLIRQKAGGGVEPIPGKEIYAQVRRAGVTIQPTELQNTFGAIKTLQDELRPLKSFPEVKATIRALQSVADTVLTDPAGVSMDNIVTARQLIGQIIKRAETAGGVKLGGAKQVFKAIAEDMDRIATSPTLKGRASRLAIAATKRAKLEFAIKDMEKGVSRFIKDIPEGGIEFNVQGFQKWLRNVTDRRNKQFDKNFSDALKDDLPQIKARLAELAKLGKPGSPGGPGSLVVRGRFAAMGAIIGGFMGGGIGSAAGAVIGAHAPEMIVGTLTTNLGSKFLSKAANMGKGEISNRSWAALGALLARSTGERGEQPFSVPNRPIETEASQ